MERSESDALNVENLASAIVDSGLNVHRALGPGLLESTYEHCLAHELLTRRIEASRQKFLPVIYDGIKIDAGYRLDMVVEEAVVIEIKAVETLNSLHEAQLLTYLKLSPYSIGFLLNFNVVLFKHGIRRFRR